MNTLKPLLIVAVLAGIGYGVYVRINGGNDAPPPGVAAGWDAAPKVQLPEGAAPSGAPAWPGAGGSPGAAPPFGASRGMAPPATASQGSEAPAFAQPSTNPPPGASGAPPQVTIGSAAPPFAGPPTTGPAGPEQATSVPNPGDPNSIPPRDPNAPVQPPPGVATAGAESASPPGAPSGSSPAGFATAMDAARRELEAGQMAASLVQLSSWFDDPRLSPEEQQQLNQLLDQVAGTVIYSTQHLLEAPYEVQPGEHLEDIAQRYSVPWQLLAKINGIDDPQNLRPGERLKVVRGPFNAVISLEKRQLTLVLNNGSYAGRFPIGIGREQPPREGTFAVSDKVVNPVYHGGDRAAGAGDQNNPYGQRWIGLGSDLGIHGTNHPDTIGRTDLPGSISLSPRDVEDVYDILSVGSKVIIRR